MRLFYGTDTTYAVELFDKVEIRVDGETHEGVVKAIHPKSHQVSVTYEEPSNARRVSDRGRKRRIRRHVSSVELLARDG